ncbi:hypothetical protein AB0O20_03035 [Streptomyces kronopolitis]|uniref:hypothetical protein n=1 Tax=Streptomyces kronopolitis TaxID=1612435 RepID=UPI00343D40AA
MKRPSFITGTLAVGGAGALPEFAEAHDGIDAVLHGSDAADLPKGFRGGLTGKPRDQLTAVISA